MTHFIELLKKWDEHKKGAVVEVGKSTAHMLVTKKLGVRVDDPARQSPIMKTEQKKPRKRCRGFPTKRT